MIGAASCTITPAPRFCYLSELTWQRVALSYCCCCHPRAGRPLIAVGTPFEGGIFRMKLVLPADFPASPPRGFFLTKIFHPNVAEAGDICVNTLKRDWDPNHGLRHIFEVIRCLLIEPFPESALNEEAGKLLIEDHKVGHMQRWIAALNWTASCWDVLGRPCLTSSCSSIQGYEQRAKLMTGIYAKPPKAAPAKMPLTTSNTANSGEGAAGAAEKGKEATSAPAKKAGGAQKGKALLRKKSSLKRL